MNHNLGENPVKDSEKEISPDKSSDFIRDIINQDRAEHPDKSVKTRFPPEPNGYLHIGHAKAICVNYFIAKDYNGTFNLRFDDTNPEKEETEYVDGIEADIKWLGAIWNDQTLYASDYFAKMYELAELLIINGKAYVDSLTAEQIREYAGRTLVKDETTGKMITPPGKNSPYRDREVEENLALFRRMRAGQFDEGAHVLRAKIDMAHPNLNMRDPVIYRIQKQSHHRTGATWCIYPMYDYAHPIEDALEGITYSLCSLEFENHRPLYDWVLENTGLFRSRQIEFARLNLTKTVLSKRWLRSLVEDKVVAGWDDPRMPTLCGLRRRGYTPESIRDFCARIGIAKADSRVDIRLLEHCLREQLNKTALRRMAVLNPLKVIVENVPAETVEHFAAVNNPEDPDSGTRPVPFTREIYIEREDFMENPVKGFFRLSPGKEVRLRYAYLFTCNTVEKDISGNVVAVRGVIDPDSKGGNSPDGRKVKATLHWVSAKECVPLEVRLYDYLFTQENPQDVPDGVDWKTNVNPNSLIVSNDAVGEAGLNNLTAGEIFQFERLGYFIVDPDSSKEKIVFNRSVSLKESK